MGLSREEFYRELTALWPPKLQSGWEEILNRRAQGTPVAYLIGEKEFFSLVLEGDAGGARCRVRRRKSW